MHRASWRAPKAWTPRSTRRPCRGDGGETAVNDAAQSVEQRGELLLCQRREEGVKGTQIQCVGESAEQVTEQAAALMRGDGQADVACVDIEAKKASDGSHSTGG